MSSRAWSGGQQVLAPGLDPADRPAEQPRGRRRRQLLAVERDLLAEAAADVRRDHPHAALGDPEPRRQRRAHRVGDLGAVPERQGLVAGQPACQAAARLHRRVGLAPLVEARRRRRGRRRPTPSRRRRARRRRGTGGSRAPSRRRAAGPASCARSGSTTAASGSYSTSTSAQASSTWYAVRRRSRRRPDRRRSAPCRWAGSASPSAAARRWAAPSSAARATGARSAPVSTATMPGDTAGRVAVDRARSERGRAGCARRRRGACPAAVRSPM